MDILTIKHGLHGDVQRVAEYLLPCGVKHGSEWRVGSVAGEKGQSLGIHLTGEKAGVWSDFSTGEAGDLISLWMAVRGMDLSAALQDISGWLGLERPKPIREPKRNYKRPPRPKCQSPTGRVMDYLTEVRNVPTDMLARYKIGEQGDVIIFPFLLPNGDLVLAKARKAEDGAKPKPTMANCEPILFGWQAIDPNAREVTICEGEIDAPSLCAYGWPALSVPYGGGKGEKQKWIESEFERLERFEKIYLALDNDEQGNEAAAEISDRLGRHKCYRVTLPLKDGNACLMEGIAKEVIDEAFKNAICLDPEGLRKASDYADEVIRLFWPKEGDHIGYRTPYGKLGDKMLFRPAELTLWTGASGAGKSQILSDCAVDWISQGGRVCIASLEMKGKFTLKRMVKQLTGVDRPTEEFIVKSLTWLDQGLLIYDLIGKTDIKSILAVFDYARAKYGCDMFSVDSLMRLGVASDDYVGQEKCVFELIDWTISNNVHTNLVAHSRKGTVNSGAPETEDIKGASEIGSNAFNIISVWRDRELEDNIKQAEIAVGDAQKKAEPIENKLELLEELKEQYGVILNIAKQRNGDFEGKIGLWFDQTSYRYYSAYDRSLWSRQYMPVNQ